VGVFDKIFGGRPKIGDSEKDQISIKQETASGVEYQASVEEGRCSAVVRKDEHGNVLLNAPVGNARCLEKLRNTIEDDYDEKMR
jgi:hypothetical protein